MSWLKASCALLVALAISAGAAAAPVVTPTGHHWRHAHRVGPLLGVGPGYDLYGPPGVYSPSYGYGGGEGPVITRGSGGVNSMSNDFGTSGVLGHSNGMPITGH